MTRIILIVDDQPEDLHVLADYLKEHGDSYEIMKAPSANIALKLIEKKKPDLIITDWEMPVMNGIEFVKELRKNNQTIDIPVVMCTGVMTSSENLQTALKAGASDYIRKPIDKIELIARTHSMLQLAISQQNVKEQIEKLHDKAERQNILNQKLFAQKLEIELQYTEIKEKEQKIEKQNSDLIIGKEELQQYNKELLVQREQIEEQYNQIFVSEDKYRAVVDNMDDVFYRTDVNQKITLVSPSGLQYTNFTDVDDLIGKDVVETFYGKASERGRLLKALQDNNGSVTNYELQLNVKDNQVITFETNSHFIFDHQGNIEGIEGMLRNITQQKAAEQAIKLSERKYRILFEDSNDAISLIDGNKIIDCNAAALKMFDYKHKEELLKLFLSDLSPEKQVDGRLSAELAAEMITIALEKGVNKFEWTHKKANGELFPAEVWLTAIPYNDIIAIHNVVRDLTEKKEAEYQLKQQKEKIEQAHKNITDSINYAKTIQEALLTSKQLIDCYIKNYFILNMPKDQVSGDFYYVNKVDNTIVVAVADCTGHGVPGGFMTMLGITYIHEIVRRKEADTPGEALNMLRNRIKQSFRTFGSDNNNGLDIAYCSIDTETNILQYAGAYNPLIIIRDNELIEYKATKNPIGIYPREKDFENNIIQIQNNDLIYMFSDGFMDQANGMSNKKFMSRKFKNLLVEIHKLSMQEQKQQLTDIFNDWKGQTEQTDDVLVFGVKI